MFTLHSQPPPQCSRTGQLVTTLWTCKDDPFFFFPPFSNLWNIVLFPPLLMELLGFALLLCTTDPHSQELLPPLWYSPLFLFVGRRRRIISPHLRRVTSWVGGGVFQDAYAGAFPQSYSSFLVCGFFGNFSFPAKLYIDYSVAMGHLSFFFVLSRSLPGSLLGLFLPSITL